MMTKLQGKPWIVPLLAMSLFALPLMSQKGQPAQASATGNRVIDRAVQLQTGMRQAHEYLRQENWTEAINALEEVSKLGDDHGSPMELAHAYEKAGRDSEAIAQYENLAEKGLHVVEAYFHLAAIQADGDEASAYGQLEKALAAGFIDPERMMDDRFANISDQDRFQGLMKQAWQNKKLRKEAKKAANREDWDGAVEAYTQYMDAAPNDNNGLSGLVYAQIRGGYLDDAATSLQAQIDMNHRPSVAHYNLACVYALNGQSSRGLEQLEQAINLGWNDLDKIEKDGDLDNLRDEEGYAAIVNRFSQRKSFHAKLKRAAADADLTLVASMVADLEPKRKYPELYEKLAYSLAKKGDFAESTRAFEKEIATGHGNLGNSLYNIACNKAQQGKTDEAFTYLENALVTGFNDQNHIAGDSDLKSLREDPRFAIILEQAGAIKGGNHHGVNVHRIIGEVHGDFGHGHGGTHGGTHGENHHENHEDN